LGKLQLLEDKYLVPFVMPLGCLRHFFRTDKYDTELERHLYSSAGEVT